MSCKPWPLCGAVLSCRGFDRAGLDLELTTNLHCVLHFACLGRLLKEALMLLLQRSVRRLHGASHLQHRILGAAAAP